MYPSLKALLNYHNKNVFDRYHQDFPNNKLSAPEAMRELTKFMWLTRKHEWEQSVEIANQHLDFKCVIHEEMNEIDDMWHTFLLFTHDYHQFCKDYLNDRFFHHIPNTRKTDPPTKEQYKIELERYLSYIYDNLGEETLQKWFFGLTAVET